MNKKFQTAKKLANEVKKETGKDCGAVVDKMVNDEKLLRSLARMSERWADERGYEDFSGYAEVMRGLTDHEFIRATKRPFGFVVRVEGVKVAVYLKNYSAYCVLAAKSVKK